MSIRRMISPSTIPATFQFNWPVWVRLSVSEDPRTTAATRRLIHSNPKESPAHPAGIRSHDPSHASRSRCHPIKNPSATTPSAR
jgi:hypothetical protein